MNHPNENENTQPANPSRRQMLGKLVAGTAALAAGGVYISHEDRILSQAMAEDKPADAPEDMQLDAVSGASRTDTNWARYSDLKKKMTTATIKGIDFSRMMMGGNLIGGWAHSRDLMYVSDLVKAYHTRKKITATFKMAEACGINTYLGHHSHIGMMKDYWDEGGSLHYIADASSLDGALHTIEVGASAAYIQGETCDRLVREDKFDEMVKYLERVRQEGVPAGLGAHWLETVKACEERGIKPDFWMKTIHHGGYWSRHADKHECDNVFDRNPDETIAYMNELPQPWIGFKVLAAGAIRPQDGFRYALEAGADFLCVGMYDFQIVDDVNIFMEILDAGINRKRPWCFT